ncbi:MAG: VOC family protein [Acidimicrobiales bacterium]
MPARETAPNGAPCWVDLMTSDVEGSRRFYGELFGWTSDEPNTDFGGYFNFHKEGTMIAGGMPTMGEGGPTDVWSVYLKTDDARKTFEVATAEGAQVLSEPMDVAEFGTMAVIADPTGAAIGIWQPDTHQGFGVLGEPGTPAWFELHTRDYPTAVAFYRTAFGWDAQTMSDTPELRYTVQSDGEDQLAGIMDASSFLPEGVPAYWAVYFAVADVDAALAKTMELGGSIVQPAEDTPYGRLATAVDPSGGVFKLMGPNAAS